MAITAGDAQTGTGLAGKIIEKMMVFMRARFGDGFEFGQTKKGQWAMADAYANAISEIVNPELGGGGGPGISDGDKGDITVSGSGVIWTIDVDSVTFTKMQNVATQTIAGRSAAGSGDMSSLSLTNVLDWAGSSRGSLLYRGAVTWSAIAPGTSGYVLTSAGAGADPFWAKPKVNGYFPSGW